MKKNPRPSNVRKAIAVASPTKQAKTTRVRAAVPPTDATPPTDARSTTPTKVGPIAIRAALLLMGDDADTVAEYLLDRGAKGLTDGSIQGCCPVSRWIVKRFDARAVSIGVKQALVKIGDRVLTVELPTATRTFLSRFDAGYYPELEDRS